MIRTLEIIAGSWPIAVMAIGAMGSIIVMRVINWRKKVDEEDKAYRASQAVAVRTREND